MAENLEPVFLIQRVYLKDLSLEQPNSPAILLAQESPAVDIQIGIGSEAIAEAVFEITVTATVTAKIEAQTLFLVEAKQAGIAMGIPFFESKQLIREKQIAVFSSN